MYSIIDAATDLSNYAEQLAKNGVTTAIRYYNNNNTPKHPSKCLKPAEAKALHVAGLSIATVFEQRGGADKNISDLSATNGARDAKRALELAQNIGQPKKSAIYFAVDDDYARNSDLDLIGSYFEKANEIISDAYEIGVYGSGTVGNSLIARGLVRHIWLAGATGWSGTREMMQSHTWTLFQQYLEKTLPFGGFGYDGNIANPAFGGNFGQFKLDGGPIAPPQQPAKVIMKVTARSGLRLRAGPGESYEIKGSLPLGTLVTGLRAEGQWVLVDVEGDGNSDGYMFGGFLETLSGGFPIVPPRGHKPIDVARDEMALGVREIPGEANNNPRIVMYHATTSGGKSPDETPRCSSFVNFCVEQSGFRGTDSKWAMSWHERNWGQDVTARPPKETLLFSNERRMARLSVDMLASI